MDQHWRVDYPDLIAKGYNIVKVKVWRDITIQAGDYSDVVHLDDGGYDKLAQAVYLGIRLAAGYTNP